MSEPKMIKMTLVLDESDYAVIQREITRYQRSHHATLGKTIIPDGDSGFSGAIVAELMRELDELRSMFDKDYEERKRGSE